jgi:hypothetical protein
VPFEHPGYEPREESAPPRTVEANAPSSPQWSLNEQRADTDVAEREPEPSRPAAQESFTAPTVSEPVAEVEPEPTEPREARKGWWQRRFKI